MSRWVPLLCYLPILFSALLLPGPNDARADSDRRFGFARLDITPKTPLRLSGYGNRTEPFTAVDHALYVRAMAIQASDGKRFALVSMDTIGLPGALAKRIATRVEGLYSIPRSRLVMAFSHSHTAPHIEGGLTNLFARPLTETEVSGAHDYTEMLVGQVIKSVGRAINDLAPGRIAYARGKVTFAENRRVLADGKWVGFGVNAHGPVDHSLPVLQVVDDHGKTRGVVFNYACHCTTFGGDHNQVNGDWAGYASEYIEREFPGAVALCTIGCGADANPPRDSTNALQNAQREGREIATEVTRLLGQATTPLTDPLATSFGYAGLPVDRPTLEDLKTRLSSARVQERNHAQHMLALHERMGRLPETYPAPIQVWRFGDQLTMVFLGGEVVVDYALRIQRELAPAATWVTAYANDLFAYVASERIRREGGYEVDRSMIYYDQPGPWAKGTEDVLMRRVHELIKTDSNRGPYGPAESVRHFHLADGFSIELVAAEPLIRDPVNFAFGPDGRLWVVEMGDYPRGEDGKEKPGGRVKFLEDVDGDGRYDRATLFLDGIPFPTGVWPWRKGVIVTSAPDVLYAEDRDGDGRADSRTVLFHGFVESNPQHRINGFAYGLDNWLYLGSGSSSKEIRCVKTGEVVNVSGRDMRIDADRDLLEPVSGRTQYGRQRDDWGHWFASTNSEPLFQFVVSDRYLKRNPFVRSPNPLNHLLQPQFAPPVYPTSRTIDRFNDLFAANRFTSACGVTVFRDSSLGRDVQGAAFVCENVHNLVMRAMLARDGVLVRGSRHSTEQHSEFLSSDDNWFRPVWLATGPDGALWIADMYRMVIEHPEWIPEAWQAQLNLRAGEERGRIYRVYRKGERPGPIPDLAAQSSMELVKLLASSNGWQRDMAQQQLVHREDHSVLDALRAMASGHTDPLARLHAFCTLDGLDSLDPELLAGGLADRDPGVVRRAILLSESHLNTSPQIGRALEKLVDHPDVEVRFQLALTLGYWSDQRAAELLSRLLIGNQDPWIRHAVISSAHAHAAAMLPFVVPRLPDQPSLASDISALVATAVGRDPSHGAATVLRTIAGKGEILRWQLDALAEALRALEREGIDWQKLKTTDSLKEGPLVDRLKQMIGHARKVAGDSSRDVALRISAIPLLGHGTRRQEDLLELANLLSAQEPPSVQSAAAQAMGRIPSEQVPAVVLDNWAGYAPRLQSELLAVLLSRTTWTRKLLQAVESGTLPPADLDAATRDRLLTYRAGDVRELAARVLSGSGTESRQLVLGQYQDVLKLAGNALRGSEVFDRVCAACHAYRAMGIETGAPLASLQDKSSSSLLTSLLDPNRAVEQKYRSYSVVTVDGRVTSGLIVSESATGMTLALTNGDRQHLLRVDIDEITNTGKSLMPEGLEQDLSRQEMADVIAFIQSPPRPPTELDPSAVVLLQGQLSQLDMTAIGRPSDKTVHVSLPSPFGPVSAPVCSKLDDRVLNGARPKLAWSSQVIQNGNDRGETRIWRLPVIMGARGTVDRKFHLSINGHKMPPFAPTLTDGNWPASDGAAGVRFLALHTNGKQAVGLLFLTLPAAWLPVGTSVDVALEDHGSNGWVAILPH